MEWVGVTVGIASGFVFDRSLSSTFSFFEKDSKRLMDMEQFIHMACQDGVAFLVWLHGRRCFRGVINSSPPV